VAALLEKRTRPVQFDLVGLGETSLDLVCEVDSLAGIADKAELPAAESHRLRALLEGEVGGALALAGEVRVPLETASVLPGGQVSTTVLGCARLGWRCALVSSVGQDAAAERALLPLRAAGVDLAGVRRVAAAQTRTALILVERKSGDRSVLFCRDPLLDLDLAGLARSEIEGAGLLLLDATDPDASLWAAGIAREAGIPVVLDADRLAPGTEALLRLADFPVVSRRLAEEISERGSSRQGVVALHEMGARMAVATLGPEGAIACDGEGVLASPAFAVDARDTTGAGDAFHAGFLWALAAGLDRVAVLRVANAVAGMNCTAPGAQGGLPSRSELERFLRGQPGG